MTRTMDPWTLFVVWAGGTAAGVAIGFGILWVVAKAHEHREHRRFIRRINP